MKLASLSPTAVNAPLSKITAIAFPADPVALRYPQTIELEVVTELTTTLFTPVASSSPVMPTALLLPAGPCGPVAPGSPFGP